MTSHKLFPRFKLGRPINDISASEQANIKRNLRHLEGRSYAQIAESLSEKFGRVSSRSTVRYYLGSMPAYAALSKGLPSGAVRTDDTWDQLVPELSALTGLSASRLSPSERCTPSTKISVRICEYFGSARVLFSVTADVGPKPYARRRTLCIGVRCGDLERWMARRSDGMRLVIGVAKALGKAAKEAERNRLRQQLEYERAHGALMRQEEKARKEAERAQLQRLREFDRASKDQEREQERRKRAAEKDAIRHEKDMDKRKVLEAKAEERQRLEDERNRVQQAKMALEVEREEAEACFQERCEERRALRLHYVRTLLS